jgi:serine/threonine protein phosphatase 1
MSATPVTSLSDPSLPQGELVYAVGDIHGRADLMRSLLQHIEDDAARTSSAPNKQLIFLGDYIDRGPDSRGVVELLLSGLPEGFTAHYLKGNHEDILLKFLGDPSQLDHWLMNKGETTMQSYGVDIEGLYRMDATPETWRKAFVTALPDSHWRFYRGLKLCHVIGDYAFVHAGVRPGVALFAQDPEDLVWIRGEFLNSDANFGKVVVHGHSPVEAPEVRPNRINIDTGAVFSGRLTAIRLKGAERRFLTAQG